MTPDAITFTVPVPSGVYPSVNHTNADSSRRGKKSPEYHELFRAVRAAAATEMERSGWKALDGYCEVTIVRIRSDCRRSDMMNLAKCEFDALQPSIAPRFADDLKGFLHPFPGLVLDDNLLVPTPRIEYDPEGENRIVILARRIYPFVPTPRERALAKVAAVGKPLRRQSPKTPQAEPDRICASGPSDRRRPLINGVPADETNARALLNKYLRR